MQTKLVVVLGMHRSGTSTIARGLMTMGVDLGRNLMRPALGNNKKGFWEDLDINELNIEMLNFLNKDWHFMPSLSSLDFDALQNNGYFTRASKLLEEKTSVSKVFGFKDPRTARLLPFWKSVFAQNQLDVHYVICLRHPLSVCRSLEKRDRFDFETGGFLWVGHMVDSLSETIGEKKIIVDYDRVMLSPSGELTRIANAFDFAIDLSEVEKYKNNFLDLRLQHTVYKPNDLLLEKAIHPLANDIYTGLLAALENNTCQDSGSFTSQVLIWKDEFERQDFEGKLPTAIVEKDASLYFYTRSLMLKIRAARLKLIAIGSRRDEILKLGLEGFRKIRSVLKK